MQDRILNFNCLEKIGEKVRLCGWVHTVRVHGKIAFFDLKDRSGVIQVVCVKDLAGKAGKLGQQDVVEIIAEVKNRDKAYINKDLPLGKIEVQALEIKILQKAEVLPFDMGGKDLNLELPTLLDYRSLTLREPKIASIFKVQEQVIEAFRDSLRKRDFTEFQAPVIIPQTAEGGAEVFEVKYFGHKAYLSQSPQFYKQILVGVFERVFSVNKTLRAEPSVTTRHLTEVTTLDAEMGFIDSWIDIMDTASDVIKEIFKSVEKHCGEILRMYNVSLPKITPVIPRLKLKEAQDIIYKRTGRDVRNEFDLSPEDEKEIGKWALEEKGSDLIFITHYPVSKRPFYVLEDPEDKGYTLSFDLIGRGLEILTGGQRINDGQKLKLNALKRNIDLAKSELYFQAFRFGMPPEGGFSFGSERIVMQILGLGNIRQASLFPRDMDRIDERFSLSE